MAARRSFGTAWRYRAPVDGAGVVLGKRRLLALVMHGVQLWNDREDADIGAGDAQSMLHIHAGVRAALVHQVSHGPCRDDRYPLRPMKITRAALQYLWWGCEIAVQLGDCNADVQLVATNRAQEHAAALLTAQRSASFHCKYTRAN
jgi:hypothetical protein